MRVHKRENVRPFDIDGTLISTPYPDFLPAANAIPIKCPYTGDIIFGVRNDNNIRLLKEEYYRGSHIIVWSRGGARWAEAVIDALGLRQYVHDAYSKPLSYFDDKDVSEWMKDRVYFGPDERYKA